MNLQPDMPIDNWSSLVMWGMHEANNYPIDSVLSLSAMYHMPISFLVKATANPYAPLTKWKVEVILLIL